VSSAKDFERCIGVGGVVLFAADTVYGLACDPNDRFAVERLYLLKRRTLDKPSAVMFFGIDDAFAAVPELGERTREALGRVLPGPVTVLVPNPAGRFPLACGGDLATLGIRVPLVPLLEGVRRPVLQSSANRELFHLKSEAEIRARFAKKDEGEDRNSWLYSYNPLTVELT